MRDKRSLHQKIQELCDCFTSTDPLSEMARVPKEDNKEEAALKWVALAVLHGVAANAKKIELTCCDDGTVAVTAKYRESPLRSPGSEVGAKIVEVVKEVVGLEGDSGKSPLALGVRDSSMELKVKFEKEGASEKVIFKFPE